MQIRRSQMGCATLIALAAATVAAQSPLGPTFQYQGRLNDAIGPVTESVNLAFTLWDHPNATTPANQIGGVTALLVTPGSAGEFTAALNTSNEFGSSAFNGERRWLQVAVNGTTLSPRQEVTLAPYAQFSQNTRGVAVDASANVGVGISAPAARLHSTDGGASARAVLGHATAVAGSSTGVWGQAESNAGVGVVGFAPAQSGLAIGVRAESASSQGYGILTGATAATGATYGLFSVANSSSGTAVFGLAASGSGATYGVHGRTGSTTGRGVFGEAAAASGLSYGVFGRSASAQGYGGYFEGRGFFSANVGLGVTNPAAPLHILGATAPAAGLPASDNGLLLGSNGVGSYKWMQSYGGSLTLNPVGNNVGIGTATPTDKLDVAGVIRSSTGGFRFPDGTSQTTAAKRTQLEGAAGTANALTGGPEVTLATATLTAASAGKILVLVNGVGHLSGTPATAEVRVVDGGDATIVSGVGRTFSMQAVAPAGMGTNTLSVRARLTCAGCALGESYAIDATIALLLVPD